MRYARALLSADPVGSTCCQAVLAIRLWTHNDLPARQSPTGGLNPGPHRAVLPRRVFRRSGALTAEVLVAGHRAPSSIGPAGAMAGSDLRMRSASLKVSEANDVREPAGEPKLMVILSVAGLCEASRGTATPHSFAS